jgi:mannose-6-phosphate isomerase-like protein (cupin superfamily)
MKYFAQDIEKITEDNTNYREVLFTGEHIQLVVMSLLPGEEIGAEVHEGHDQFIRLESGKAQFTLGEDTLEGGDGFAVVIPSGIFHNVKNVGEDTLKLYTIYSPKEHPENTVQKTKLQ